MNKTLEMIVGHWYRTRDGRLAVVLCCNGRAWNGAVLNAIESGWISETWDDYGNSLTKASSIATHCGEAMPAIDILPQQKWVPWDSEENLVGLIVFQSDRPVNREMIVAQDFECVHTMNISMNYAELLDDGWAHKVGSDFVPCGRLVKKGEN